MRVLTVLSVVKKQIKLDPISGLTRGEDAKPVSV